MYHNYTGTYAQKERRSYLMRVQNENLALNGTDMQSNIASNPIWLGHIVNYSIQLVYTGSPNGSLKLQGSNDEGAKSNNVENVNITNWSDIADTAVSVTAAGSNIYNIQNAGYRWVRLVWTNSSSGSPSTLTSARYNVKGI